MSDDPYDDPQWQAYAQQAREHLAPMIDESSVTVSLVPEGSTDIKFALELGLSIMMSKPIIVVALPGRDIPPGLAKVADRVLEMDIDDPDAGARMMAAVQEVLAEREDGNGD